MLYAVCVVLAYFMEKKDKEMYPEYYAEIEKDVVLVAAPVKAFPTPRMLRSTATTTPPMTSRG